MLLPAIAAHCTDCALAMVTCEVEVVAEALVPLLFAIAFIYRKQTMCAVALLIV